MGGLGRWWRVAKGGLRSLGLKGDIFCLLVTPPVLRPLVSTLLLPGRPTCMDGSPRPLTFHLGSVGMLTCLLLGSNGPCPRPS